jgi:hypothetical protein
MPLQALMREQPWQNCELSSTPVFLQMDRTVGQRERKQVEMLGGLSCGWIGFDSLPGQIAAHTTAASF